MPLIPEEQDFLELYEQHARFELMMLAAQRDADCADKKRTEVLEDLEQVRAMMKAYEEEPPPPPPPQPSSPPNPEHDVSQFTMDLYPDNSEHEFVQMARMSRKSFLILVNMIKDDPVFHGPMSIRQPPVEKQLMIVLFRLGLSGEAASIIKISRIFGTSSGGAIPLTTKRVFNAIKRYKKKYISWPDREERESLATETISELPHCIAYVGNSEIEFAEKPTYMPETYFSKFKFNYAQTAQIVCDHKLRIRNIVPGQPASKSYAEIFNNCPIATNPKKFFSEGQWIAGDSSYRLTANVLTPFDTQVQDGWPTLEQRKDFNRIFNHYRSRVDRCINLLKSRFDSLRGTRIQIRDEASVQQSARWVVICAIVHNFLIECNETTVFEEYVEERAEETVLTEHNQPTDEGESRRLTLLQLMNDLIG